MQCHSPGGRVVSTFKPANHLPTTVNCNSCHRTTNWTPAFFTHNGVAPGTCSKCHNQTTAVGKPTTHIPTTMSCDSCHRTVGWMGAAFKHQGVASGTCVTCHNGIQARGKPAGHISTAASCDTCHQMGAANWVLVSTGYNHSGVVPGTCASCHNGTKAAGKPATHIPTTPACDTCHKSTTAFGPGTPMNHTGITTGCATCHSGGYAGVVSKPATTSRPARPARVVTSPRRRLWGPRLITPGSRPAAPPVITAGRRGWANRRRTSRRRAAARRATNRRRPSGRAPR